MDASVDVNADGAPETAAAGMAMRPSATAGNPDDQPGFLAKGVEYGLMTTQCNATKLMFHELDSREVVGRFDGGETTSARVDRKLPAPCCGIHEPRGIFL